MFLFSFGMISHNAFADQAVATIPVSSAFGVATNPNTHMTYVGSAINGYHIRVIDDTSNAVVAGVTTASVPPGSENCYTYTVAVNPITNMIYANNAACMYWPIGSSPTWIPQTVSAINGTNNNVVAV